MKISVVIPVYNEEKCIRETLDALLKNSVQPDEIIVADGLSNDKTLMILRNEYPSVRVVDNPFRTAAAGRNVGVKVATGDVIAFTDGDCIPDTHWIEVIHNTLESENIDGLGGKVLCAPAENKYEKYWGTLAWETIMQFPDEAYMVNKCTLNDAFVTANCAYTRKLIKKIGGFSKWFGNNAEDVDFCWRALKSGARLKYLPTAVVYAHNVTTIKGIAKKSFRNGVSSSKLQKKYGSKINYDPNIYRMLGSNLIGLLKRKENAGLNLIELFSHLAGKYYGSVKVHVINI